MAAGSRAMNIDLEHDHDRASSPPPISALFLIYFDIKAGYTIGWKRSIAGVELEGVVEYKSLPSGLHTVKEDLIYFVHGNHAGLSAFVNEPAGEEVRNARMIAVGVMVPLSYGRLGRSWKHAEQVKEMASQLIINTSNTTLLEEYWENHKAQVSESPLSSPSIRHVQTKGHRNRSSSDGTALLSPEHNLSNSHPAWSLPRLLETFGPLIFPIHRAALLRKRILITAHAPVEETCNFVYDISILSNIPLAVTDLLAANAPPQRLRPLFSIGIHDIPLLEEDLRASQAATSDSDEDTDEGYGWIACTTDSILAMKKTLYDILITMPPPYSENATEKIWPKVETSKGIEIKATQRDLRRYKALRWGLSHPSPPSSPNTESESTLPRTPSSLSPRDDPMLDIPDMDPIIEPSTWSALAYSGFMWWASAGEQGLHSSEETDSDTSLFTGLSLSPSSHPTKPAPAHQEMGIVAYFHRLTTQFLSTLSDILDTNNSSSDEEISPEGHLLSVDNDTDSEGQGVHITSADVSRMGLDIWSISDHEFIETIAREYFDRKASIDGRSVDVCGIRIC